VAIHRHILGGASWDDVYHFMDMLYIHKPEVMWCCKQKLIFFH
jgi:hypothetical protein